MVNMMNSPNHPVILWGACFLWVTSMFAVAWSLALFFCIGDIVHVLGLDLVMSMILLSGIIMLPTNVHMLYLISRGQMIHHKSKVICCPLWLCMGCIIFVNLGGALLCAQKIKSCWTNVSIILLQGLRHYRSIPKYKHFMDSLQWTLKCCGLNSYTDWFRHDWYDKVRDYEWDPSSSSIHKLSKKFVTDSVPLSCCKSGSCIANFLTEMGSGSINVDGCGNQVFRLVMITLVGHLIMFLSIIIVEILLLKVMIAQSSSQALESNQRAVYNVKHILPVRENFEASSGSLQPESDESDNSEGEHSCNEEN